MAGKVEVLYYPNIIQPHTIATAIANLGFPSSVLEDSSSDGSDGDLTVCIRGMTCSSCVYSIEKNISSQDGIISISVALATEKGKIRFA